MLKKTFIAVAFATLCTGWAASAQTNLQVFYDFGKDRKHVTTTIEGFYADNWGNTFFFIDHDFNAKDSDNKIEAPAGTYMEIARCLNFWQNTPVSPLSLHVEYNGGIYQGYTIKNAFLAGLDWFIHSKDFRNTLNLKVLYKYIHKTHATVPMQFTVVWGMQDLFGLKGLRFSGFADFWWEDQTLFTDNQGNPLATSQQSRVVFISEPQLWYNVGRHFGVDNLNIGGEVELSFDFGTAKGFWARPCAGLKWVF